MKSLLQSLFLTFAVLSLSPVQTFADTHDLPPPQERRTATSLYENAMDHPVVLGERPGDHPVVLGERPGDAAGGTEHLAPLIFMVMAFLITVIIGVVLWRKNTWNIPAILAGTFALVTFLLLAGVTSYLTDQHPGMDFSSGNHHWFEMILSIAACILMLLIFVPVVGAFLQYVFTFIAGVAELVVIVILLNIFPQHGYFKICNGQCVMRGSQAGVTFDLPCADNVAFMALHHTTGIAPSDFYQTYLEDQTLPHFVEYMSAVAMHEPLYPGVVSVSGNLRSENIAFTLDESTRNPVAACSLYVYTRRYTQAELESPSFSFPYLPESAASLAGVWSRTGNVLTRTFPTASTVEAISHTASFAAEAGKVTFISYKFKITYSNPAGEESVAPEDTEVTFVLQDYYSLYPDHPVPVYSQGDMRDVMDILFVPAQNDMGSDPLDHAFFADFRTSCRSIIRDVVFKEPSLRFWRKHFNFWINPHPGRASDGRCGDCCHVAPTNMDMISNQIEFKALLHSDLQLDFTDHCNTLFSAEMLLVNDNNEKSSFLHELGHAAFGLCDEYPGGFNHQATEHLPNNWESRSAAQTAAPMRHKASSDAVRLH